MINFTKDQENEIKMLCQCGYTIREISLVFNCSKSPIHRVLKKKKCKMKGNKTIPRLVEKFGLDFIKDLKTKKAPFISEKWGLKLTTVKFYIREVNRI